MKQTTRNNFRVVVTPRRIGNFGMISVPDTFFGQSAEEIAKEYEERCQEMASAIKRHTDNVGHVSVEYDTLHRCSFCKYNWDVSEDDSDPDYPKGIPMCCDQAQAEWKAAQTKEVAQP